MISQTSKGLNSRSEANPFNEEGFLPLITAPMYSVINESNYQVFLDNKIQVCLPRNIGDISDEYFCSLSLKDFIQYFIELEEDIIPDQKYKICIDTANGNIPALHDAIRKAKEIHGSNLIIMAGNVASVEAFIELAKTGVDYIRVGIGGGGGCNTTSNTGVGQEDLEILIRSCKHIQNIGVPNFFPRTKNDVVLDCDREDYPNLKKVKLVADGISSYIKLCQNKYGFNDNGYAAINKLLFAGADLVMVGKLFAQCLESAGEKACFVNDGEILIQDNKDQQEILFKEKDNLFVKYAGMSTQKEQKKYKDIRTIYVVAKSEKGELFLDRGWFKKGDYILYGGLKVNLSSDPMVISENCFRYTTDKFPLMLHSGDTFTTEKYKPSEGSIKWIPIRWTLDEWLNGSSNQDEYPYLMGWVNSIKSAMAYTGKAKLINNGY